MVDVGEIEVYLVFELGDVVVFVDLLEVGEVGVYVEVVVVGIVVEMFYFFDG